MEYNPIFTNLDLCHIIRNIWEDNSFKIVMDKNKPIDIDTFLNVKFYAFKFDANLNGYDSYQDMTEEDMKRIIANGNFGTCLVEQYNRETSFSKNFEILSSTIRLTFALQETKASVLDTYIQYLHETRRCNYDLFEDVNGKKYKYFVDFGTLETLGDSFPSALGKIAIYQVDVKLGAILNAIAYGSGVDYRIGLGNEIEMWPYTDDNHTTKTEPLLFNAIKSNVTFQTRPATIYQKSIGQILTSGSSVFVFESYDFVDEDTIVKQIINTAKMTLASHCYENGVDIKPEVVLNDNLAVNIYEVRGNKNYVYTFILTSYDEDIVNSEFVKRTITLQLRPNLVE
jgi:hypothetical protein